jgi:exosortase/archaeosortase family protein
MFYTPARKIGETYLFIVGTSKPLVRIGASCNGLEPLVLFAIFIIAYPGKTLHKLWFIPSGIVIIHLINIIRNYVLTLMVYFKMPSFDFFHRYVFVILVYLIIFGFWMLWVNHFSLKGLKNSKKSE